MIKVDQHDMLQDDQLNTSNPHFCQPKSHSEYLALNATRAQKHRIRDGRVRPRRAYADARASVSADFGGDHQERDLVSICLQQFKILNLSFKILSKIKPYSSARSSFYRTLNEKYPVIRGVAGIPNDLKLTYKARNSTDLNDPSYGEQWIRYEQQNPPYLVSFNILQDLRLMHDHSDHD